MNDIGMQVFAFLVELAGIKELSELINSLDGMDQATKDFFSVIGVISCIFGLLQCFFGYKLFKFWCSVTGFLVGGSIGMAISASGTFAGSPAAGLIGLLVIIVFGCIGSFLAYKAYLVGLFIYAFFAAFLIVSVITAIITNSIIIGLGVGISAGIALGIVAVIHRRFFIILVTSIFGGISICSGLMMVIQSTELGWAFLIPLLLMVAGFFVQNMTVKKGNEKSGKFYATPVTQIYPAQPPPVYPPEQQPVQQPEQQPVQPQEAPVAVNDGQAAVVHGNNFCGDCGSPLTDNTAPCSNCVSAVQIDNETGV